MRRALSAPTDSTAPSHSVARCINSPPPSTSPSPPHHTCTNLHTRKKKRRFKKKKKGKNSLNIISTSGFYINGSGGRREGEDRGGVGGVGVICAPQRPHITQGFFLTGNYTQRQREKTTDVS